MTNVMEMMAIDISFMASTEAFLVEVYPWSNLAWTASTTTMASSTTIPIASSSAKSVSKLMLKLKRYKKKNVPIMATGTEMAGINVDRKS